METREHDEDDNKCPGCGNDRMDGHKLNCPEPLTDAIERETDELLNKLSD